MKGFAGALKKQDFCGIIIIEKLDDELLIARIYPLEEIYEANKLFENKLGRVIN